MAVEINQIGVTQKIGSCMGCGDRTPDTIVAELNVGGVHPRLCKRCLLSLERVIDTAMHRLLLRQDHEGRRI